MMNETICIPPLIHKFIHPTIHPSFQGGITHSRCLPDVSLGHLGMLTNAHLGLPPSLLARQKIKKKDQNLPPFRHSLATLGPAGAPPPTPTPSSIFALATLLLPHAGGNQGAHHTNTNATQPNHPTTTATTQAQAQAQALRRRERKNDRKRGREKQEEHRHQQQQRIPSPRLRQRFPSYHSHSGGNPAETCCCVTTSLSTEGGGEKESKPASTPVGRVRPHWPAWMRAAAAASSRNVLGCRGGVAGVLGRATSHAQAADGLVQEAGRMLLFMRSLVLRGLSGGGCAAGSACRHIVAGASGWQQAEIGRRRAVWCSRVGLRTGRRAVGRDAARRWICCGCGGFGYAQEVVLAVRVRRGVVRKMAGCWVARGANDGSGRGSVESGVVGDIGASF